MGRSLESRVEGLQVSLDNLNDGARYVAAIKDYWDAEVVARYTKHIQPLTRGKDGHIAAQVDGWHNSSLGRFEQADNLHGDVADAHHTLYARMSRVSGLLRRLHDATQTIADNYDATELRNAEVQKKVAALLAEPSPGSREDPSAGSAAW